MIASSLLDVSIEGPLVHESLTPHGLPALHYASGFSEKEKQQVIMQRS